MYLKGQQTPHEDGDDDVSSSHELQTRPDGGFVVVVSFQRGACDEQGDADEEQDAREDKTPADERVVFEVRALSVSISGCHGRIRRELRRDEWLT